MNIKEIFVIFFIVILFTLLSIYKIELPGLYEDEAFRTMPALEILQNRTFLPNLYSVKILGKEFPIMLTPFSGTINAYILIPVIYIFGLTVEIVRLSQVFFAALGIFLTFLLCRKLFDRRVAIISIFLLAINPSFILFNRQGLLVNSVNFPIITLGILMILRWLSKRKKIYLYSGFFILGIALFNSANYLWLMIALAFSCYIVFKDELKVLFNEKKLERNDLIVSFYFLLLGAGPFIWYNIQYWETVGSFIENLSMYYKNVGWLWYFKALLKNIETFIFMLSGAYNAGSYGYSKGVINHVYPLLFLASIIFTPSLLSRQKNKYSFKKVLFLLLTIIFILLQAPLSLEDVSADNLYIVYPFVQIIIAVFLIELYYFLKNVRALIYLMLIFFVMLYLLEMFIIKGYLHPLIAVIFLVLNLYFFVRRKGLSYFSTIFICLFIFLESATISGYYKAVAKSGGIGQFSDAIYELADFLKENKDLKPIAMDWGFRNRLLILTDGEINAKVFYSEKIRNNRYFNRMAEKLLERDGNLYLVNSPHINTPGETWSLFKKIAISNNITLREIKRFHQRNGKPVIYLYKRIFEYDFQTKDS